MRAHFVLLILLAAAASIISSLASMAQGETAGQFYIQSDPTVLRDEIDAHRQKLENIQKESDELSLLKDQIIITLQRIQSLSPPQMSINIQSVIDASRVSGAAPLTSDDLNSLTRQIFGLTRQMTNPYD